MVNHKEVRNYKEIKEKAKITKNSTIIDGKNMHQIGSERAALTTSTRYTKEERSEYLRIGMNKSNAIKREKIQLRIDNAISKIGIIRFVFLLSKSTKRTKMHSVSNFRKYLIKYLRETRYNLFESVVDVDEFFYKRIKGYPYKWNCPCCGVEKIDINKTPTSIYCSRSCALLSAHENNPELRINASIKSTQIQSNPELKKLQSETQKRRHAKKTPEERKEWYKKLSDTMGDSGFLARGQSIQKTKIEKGTVIPEHMLKSYRAYKRNAIRITKRCDVSILPNSELRGTFGHHLDHIYAIKQGFMNGVPYELIGDIRNLRFEYCKNNLEKSDRITEIPQFIQEYFDGISKNKQYLDF
jgi:hypothetical protein